jgi:hypothetical protein
MRTRPKSVHSRGSKCPSQPALTSARSSSPSCNTASCILPTSRLSANMRRFWTSAARPSSPNCSVSLAVGESFRLLLGGTLDLADSLFSGDPGMQNTVIRTPQSELLRVRRCVFSGNRIHIYARDILTPDLSNVARMVLEDSQFLNPADASLFLIVPRLEVTRCQFVGARKKPDLVTNDGSLLDVQGRPDGSWLVFLTNNTFINANMRTMVLLLQFGGTISGCEFRNNRQAESRPSPSLHACSSGSRVFSACSSFCSALYDPAMLASSRSALAR